MPPALRRRLTSLVPRDRKRRVLAALGALAVTAAVSVVVTAVAPNAAAEGDSGTAAKPVGAVSLGDSFISGEAAGAYADGTDQAGNFCHRSTRAEIAMTAIPGVERRVNLACSGAANDNIQLGGNPRYGEAPQAEQLRDLLTEVDVRYIVLNIGANDVGYAPIVLDCIKAYFLIAPRCQDTWNPKLPGLMATMVERTHKSIADVRQVMSEAGYGEGDYQFILQSYSSPVTPDMRYNLTRLFHGCPVRYDDAQWGRDVAVGMFQSNLAQVAKDEGVRFMDLTPALRGREICAEGVNHDGEWVRGITIDLEQIKNGLGINIVQQSMHPNERGHAQFGRCLTGFTQIGDAAAQCVRGEDGNLAPVPVDLGQLTAPAPAQAVPTVAERTPPKSRAEAERLAKAGAR